MKVCISGCVWCGGLGFGYLPAPRVPTLCMRASMHMHVCVCVCVKNEVTRLNDRLVSSIMSETQLSSSSRRIVYKEINLKCS